MTTKLVNIQQVIANIRLDLRYATENNFVHKVIYPVAKAYLVDEAAEDLRQASREFNDRGLGIVVWDAYRPLSATKIFWDFTPAHLRNFVADPNRGSVHNRGCAVDMTLCHLDSGKLLAMPSDFDEFTERAKMSYIPSADRELKNRTLLQTIMERHNFTVYPDEWWHYNWNKYKEHPVFNIPVDGVS